MFEAKNLAQVYEYIKNKVSTRTIDKELLLLLHKMLIGNIDEITAMAAPYPAAGQTTRPAIGDVAAARFLDQATWGPTPASIATCTMGIAPGSAQFALNTSDLPDQPILNSAGKSNRDLTPVQRAFLENAVNGPDQLRQRVAFALSEIFVASAVQVGPAYAIPPYWRVLRDNAFGNYRSIIKVMS